MGWNPMVGCQHASPGCLNCYAERCAAQRRHAKYAPYLKHAPDGTPLPKWNGKVGVDLDALYAPLHVRKPQVWFTSMGDWCLLAPDEWWAMFTVIRKCPQHVFLLCTKRAEKLPDALRRHDPMRNVLIGVTVEDRQRAAERLPYLATVKEMGWRVWVSYEPALDKVFRHSETGTPAVKWDSILDSLKLDWLVAGAETGGDARPCDPVWLISAFNWARSRGVPFWCKSGWPYAEDPRERWAR
jgi:protein gp37